MNPAKTIVLTTREDKAARVSLAPKRAAVVVDPVEVISRPHPTVAAFAQAIRRLRAEHDGRVNLSAEDLPKFTIGAVDVERIISFLHRLAEALEQAGAHLEISGQWMRVWDEKDDVRFSIVEGVKRVPHILTAAERAAQAKREARIARGYRQNFSYDDYVYTPLPPEFDRVPSGEFSVEIHNWSDGTRRTWRDAKTQRLETLLPSIVSGFLAHLATNRTRREAQEKSEAERRELERRRKLAAARREREKKRELLHRQIIRADREARHLREWLGTVEATLEQSPLPHLTRMVDWSRRRLSMLVV